ncbi:MAG: thioesterase family protein [Hyphomicrobiaceae bacterium]
MQPFRYYLRVRYQDCDSQHVVFNARYSEYVDLAITQFLYATMQDRDPYDNTFEIQVKKQTIEWNAPARFQDVVEISTYVTRFGTTSFNVRFDLRVAGQPEVIVTSDTVYVHVTGQNGVWKSAPLPADRRALLEAGGKGQIVDHAGYHPIVTG